MNWIRRSTRYRPLAGVVLLPILSQAQQPPSEGNVALIVFLVAIGLTLLVALGLAALMWVLSLRSPHAAVGPEPKTKAKPRAELPPGVHLPSPSIQPLILAAGVTITAFGAVFRGFAIELGEGFSLPIILLLGLVVTVAGFVGWVREGHHTPQSH